MKSQHFHAPVGASPHINRVWRRRWLIGVVVICVLAAAWITRGVLRGQDLTWVHIRESGVWRVGMDPSFPPFENLSPATGQAIGFDVDLAQSIASRWGVRLEIAGVGFDQLLDAVAARRIDSAISALPVMPDRTREVAFSSPYFEAGVVLAKPAGNENPKLEDLAGRRIAAEWGSEGDAQARTLQQRFGGNLTLVLRSTADAALAAVVTGEADGAIVDAVSLALFNREGRKLVSVGEPLRRDPYVILTPVDAPRLGKAVNEALAELAADGTLHALEVKWFGAGAQ